MSVLMLGLHSFWEQKVRVPKGEEAVSWFVLEQCTEIGLKVILWKSCCVILSRVYSNSASLRDGGGFRGGIKCKINGHHVLQRKLRTFLKIQNDQKNNRY